MSRRTSLAIVEGALRAIAIGERALRAIGERICSSGVGVSSSLCLFFVVLILILSSYGDRRCHIRVF